MFCPINIYSQATEWRDLAPIQCIIGHTPCTQEMVNSMTANLQGKKTPRCRGDWLPHTCPRGPWTPCWELDSTILVAAPAETQVLSQHAALAWMTKRSFHISRHAWWKRNRREGLLQLMALPWEDCRRAKDSHGSRQTWLLALIPVFRLFYSVFLAPKVVSF